MNTVTILTIVPASIAKKLEEKQRVTDYNTLPQLHEQVLVTIQKFMAEKVGYSSLPIACLSMPQIKAGSGVKAGNEDWVGYIPASSQKNVIFQLEMPSDMIVSINYQFLLDASSFYNSTNDLEEMSFMSDILYDELCLGISSEENQISFIPFLEYNKCKFYAKLDGNFSNSGVNGENIANVQLRELSSFII